MSAPSTTSYSPFDSEAPTIFRTTQMNNCLNGEWLNQSHGIDFISCLPTSRVHRMAVQSVTCFWSDICSPGRRCCSTITLSLWTRRYDVCALVLSSTTWEMIRSSGSGRSSITFNESGLALISSQRLRWRLPKIVFFLNRYVIRLLILCVMCNICAQKANKHEW